MNAQQKPPPKRMDGGGTPVQTQTDPAGPPVNPDPCKAKLGPGTIDSVRNDRYAGRRMHDAPGEVRATFDTADFPSIGQEIDHIRFWIVDVDHVTTSLQPSVRSLDFALRSIATPQHSLSVLSHHKAGGRPGRHRNITSIMAYPWRNCTGRLFSSPRRPGK